ncbi:MAG: menaquinone-dependent protoporphyrinogen IX dehydrogenase [Chitinivibrionales bacterium]|nr:menaquinone-dependent protoporphyrinogen IX dehydrogenase [Chitinivibrionales bacterium]
MKTLIAYESAHGQTQKIAEAIAGHLRERGDEVTLVRCRDAQNDNQLVDGADRVVVGASVHAGTHLGPTAIFVKNHLEKLQSKPSAFYSVSLAASGGEDKGMTEARKYLTDFLVQAKWQPQHTAVFAGALPYRQYNIFLRFVLKQIVKSQGGDTDTSRDHEYTDWDRVREFAETIAGAGEQR